MVELATQLFRKNVTTQLFRKNVTCNKMPIGMMTTTEAYYGVGLLALLWGTYYFQMSDDKKRFGGETCVWSSDDELLCDEKDPNQFEDPPFVK